MAEAKIRIELNKGRVGMPLEKLAVRVENLVKFLNGVISDLGVRSGEAVWLAEEFDNGSVDFDCRLVGEVHSPVITETLEVLDSFFGNKPLNTVLAFKIGIGTKNQFRRLTRNLDPDELIRVSLYQPGNGELGPWLLVGESGASFLDEEPRLGRTYYGEIQGTVAALFKEGKMHLWVRDLSTDRRVRCFFNPDLYSEAVRALNDPGAVVFIEGEVTEDPETGETAEIHAEHIRPAPQFSMELFDSMIGAIPDYTSPLTTLEHTEVFRER